MNVFVKGVEQLKMKKTEIKQKLAMVRRKNEVLIKARINYYKAKGDKTEAIMGALNEQIKLNMVGFIFDEIDMEFWRK